MQGRVILVAAVSTLFLGCGSSSPTLPGSVASGATANAVTYPIVVQATAEMREAAAGHEKISTELDRQCAEHIPISATLNEQRPHIEAGLGCPRKNPGEEGAN